MGDCGSTCLACNIEHLHGLHEKLQPVVKSVLLAELTSVITNLESIMYEAQVSRQEKINGRFIR